MAHGVPKLFGIADKVNVSRLASENTFQASDLARIRWMGSNDSEKKAGSIVLSFLDRDLAIQIEQSGLFLNYDYHRTEKLKPRPPQCFKCLRMGHYGKWFGEPARCTKCGDNHQTNECPEGLGNVTSCVLCKEGLKTKTPGITEISHSPFNMICPYKKSWLERHPIPFPTC